LLQSQLVILQLEIPLDTAAYVVDLCHQAGIAVLLNPAPAQKLPADLIEKSRSSPRMNTRQPLSSTTRGIIERCCAAIRKN